MIVQERAIEHYEQQIALTGESAATRAASRKPRGSRAVDLMIAAVALSRSLPLITRNPSDFAHLAGLGLRVYEI